MNQQEYFNHCQKVLSDLKYSGSVLDRIGLIICPESEDAFLGIEICNRCNNKQRCVAYQ